MIKWRLFVCILILIYSCGLNKPKDYKGDCIYKFDFNSDTLTLAVNNRMIPIVKLNISNFFTFYPKSWDIVYGKDSLVVIADTLSCMGRTDNISINLMNLNDNTVEMIINERHKIYEEKGYEVKKLYFESIESSNSLLTYLDGFDIIVEKGKVLRQTCYYRINRYNTTAVLCLTTLPDAEYKTREVLDVMAAKSGFHHDN